MSAPLSGFRVLVTRAPAQASELVQLLESAGAQAIVLSSIDYEFFEGSEASELDAALLRAGQYDVIVLTSARGAEAIQKRFEFLGQDVRDLVASRQLVAVGPATAAALASAVRPPDVIPAEFSAVGIFRALRKIAGLRFLLLRADLARKNLPKWLLEQGGVVDDVVAYRIVRSQQSGAAILAGPVPHFITFTSSTGIVNTLERLAQVGMESWMANSSIVCIGPVTAQTVKELGYEVAAVANPSTAEGLVNALIGLVTTKNRRGSSFA